MPSLISQSRDICHIHVVARLRDHWVKRIRSAQGADYSVSVAAPIDCWQSEETLLTADDLGIAPMVVSDNNGVWDVVSYRSVARLIAGLKLLLNPTGLEQLGKKLLVRAQKAQGATIRGQLFEDFLAFFFSQIRDFEVFAQNYNTATEEIDIVLKNRRTDGRAWPPSTPLVLVSGKNKKTAVGASALTSLESKMNMRRGMCHLGFLCSSGTISRKAYDHELRYSAGSNVVAFLDGHMFLQLLDKPQKLTAELERHVIRASLR
jgi:Holliday junction resolvase-like predicted endonuclease